MTEWPWVLLPAAAIAVVVRIDARVVGPYFALSTVLGANEGVQAQFWYGDGTRRQAFIRRFVYPCLAGFALGWTSLSLVDVASVGFIAAGLLLWPTLFHGIPWQVPRRTWHLPVLYLSFLVAYPALAVGGLELQRLLLEISDGNVRAWLADQFVGTVLFWAVGLIGAAIFRASFGRTRAEAQRRESIGAERLSEYE